MQREMLTRRGAISQERPLPFAALSPRSAVRRRVCVTRVLQFARLRRKRQEGGAMLSICVGGGGGSYASVSASKLVKA